MFRKYTVEFPDVHFHNIEEVRLGNQSLLWIKGLIMHSAMVADHIELQHEQQQIHVQVTMALTQENKSGLFELYLPIPERIIQVTFGQERTILWTRASKAPITEEQALATHHVG